MSAANHNTKGPGQPAESAPVRFAARLSSLIWWLLLVVLLLFALYAGLGRQLTRNVDNFAEDLARELSERTGQEVAIGRLSSQWFWLDPAFTARNISVTSARTGITIAEVDHLRVRFDFLSSLRRLRLVFDDFEVDGVQLALNQTEEGELGVPGADLPEPVNNRLNDWLRLAGQWLSDPYVKITRLSLGIRDNEGLERHIDVPQLDLVYRRGLFRASGRAIKGGTTEQLASFSLVGQHFFRGDFTGQLYLDVDSGRLFDGLIDEYQWRSIRVEGFDLGGEAWLTFRSGELEQVSGTVTTPYLQLGVGEESLAPIEGIRARFGWRRTAAAPGEEARTGDVDLPGEWHLKQLEWTWNGDQVSPFSLRLAPEPGGVTVIADALPLGPSRRLLSLLPILPEAGTRALLNYRPRGYLDQVLLWLPDDASDFELSGRLRDVSLKAVGGAPGATGVWGSLFVTRNSGYVEIAAGDDPVSLAFPQLFNAGWSFSELEGLVAWQLDGPITRVYSDNLRMAYGESTRFSGAFDLKLDRYGEDNLGLRVGVENANQAMLADFVPAKVVDAQLYDWLTTAIEQAWISGVYYGHGRIDSEAPSGSFASSMRYDFDSASVSYDPRWPRVTDASGQVQVQGRNARVLLDQATTGGLALSSGTVTVEPSEAGTVIGVEAAAAVPGAAIDFWLRNSPLGEMAGAEAESLRYGGQYRLNLDLDLPLAEGRSPVVQARIQAQGGSIAYPQADLAWQDITGNLTYHSENGFSGGPLNASFLGSPVTISLARSASGSALTVRQSGRLPVAEALALAGADAERTYGLDGALSYTAGLDIGADSVSKIEIRSDLEGVSINWPEPLAKRAEEAAPLRLTVDPHDPEGLSVRALWENRSYFEVRQQATGVEVTVGHVYLGRHTLENIAIEALDLGDRWVVSTRSERAVGRVSIPRDGSLIMSDFETLRLPGSDPVGDPVPETEPASMEAFRSLDLGSWPDVDVTIADLRLAEESLGNWSFRLRPEPDRLQVANIQGRLNSLTLVGDMTWSLDDERQVSRFTGSITGGELADLNSLLGAQIPLTNTATNIELDLDWPGRPDDIAVAELNGEVSLRLDEGIILEQNNTAQLFRVFNLLNSDTLWRRLKLDFSDLYERGVAFDAISGKARLERGVVTMDPELQVVGPSGAFKLSGSTNVATEDLDMRLVVVLPLTQNLPLAALLMGAGAPIGGALFVLDKILGDPLSKLTSATYGVTGTWDDPRVDLRRVFDTGQ